MSELEPRLDKDTIKAKLILASKSYCGKSGLEAAVRVKDAIIAGDVSLCDVSADIAMAMSRLPNSRIGKRIRNVLSRVL